MSNSISIPTTSSGVISTNGVSWLGIFVMSGKDLFSEVNTVLEG